MPGHHDTSTIKGAQAFCQPQLIKPGIYFVLSPFHIPLLVTHSFIPTASLDQGARTNCQRLKSVAAREGWWCRDSSKSGTRAQVKPKRSADETWRGQRRHEIGETITLGWALVKWNGVGNQEIRRRRRGSSKAPQEALCGSRERTKALHGKEAPQPLQRRFDTQSSWEKLVLFWVAARLLLRYNPREKTKTELRYPGHPPDVERALESLLK